MRGGMPLQLELAAMHRVVKDGKVVVEDGPHLNPAEHRLWTAAGFRRSGRFQLEAAIQSAHNRRAVDGVVPWDDILIHFQAQVHGYQTLGTRVAWAACLTAAGRRDEARELLRDAELLEDDQPYWALMIDLAEMTADAQRARGHATRLTTNPRVLKFLMNKPTATTSPPP
jgi:predicted RNA polymerase sigma factor